MSSVLKKTLHENNMDKNDALYKVEVFNSTFESIADEIVRKLLSSSANSRVIFFLDQYGWSKVSMLRMKNILERLPNAEIILTFAADWILDYLPSHPDDTKKILKTCMDIGLLSSNSSLYDIAAIKNDPQWRRIMQSSFSESIRQAVGAKFYTPFFIKTSNSHRHYWLLHFSQHEIAKDEMVKVHWRTQNTFHHPGGTGFNMLGYNPDFDYKNIHHQQSGFDFTFSQSDQEKSIANMAEQLPDILRSTEHTTLRKLLQDHGNTTPADSDMLRGSLDVLLQCNEVDAIGHKNKENRKKGSAIHLDDKIKLSKNKTLFLPIKLH